MRQRIKEYLIKIPVFYKNCIKIYINLNIVKLMMLNPLVFIRHYSTFKIIVGPGFSGFKGGICNPGAVVDDHDNTIMLAKGQHHHWVDAKDHLHQHFLKGVPLVLSLDQESRVQKSYPIHQLNDFPSDDDLELEDFRLFRFHREFWVNHNLIRTERNKDYVGYSASFPSLSRLDPKRKTLTFLGYPQVDFPTQCKEKNWSFIQHNNDLYLFYSAHPYRVLKLTDRESLTFSTVINQTVNPALDDIGGFGTMVSFSINPIPYDDQHFFLLIHQVDPKGFGRLYYHWGVLIDKNSLYPTKVTFSPLFSGLAARGRVKGVIYTTSVVNRGADFIFYGGEGDTYVSYAQLSKPQLDIQWSDISNDHMNDHMMDREPVMSQSGNGMLALSHGPASTCFRG